MSTVTGPLRPLLREDAETPIGGDTPFEFLDPCCQKEILNESHHRRVGNKLRESDRSQVRLDERSRAIGRIGHTCHHHHDCSCCESSDYPLLAEMRDRRLKIEAEFAKDNYTGEKLHIDDSEDSDDLDSDDEAMLAGLSEAIPMTPEELERVQAIENAALDRENALQMGYGEHVEASIEHIMKTAGEYGETVVCHVFQPKLALCALLDLELEVLAVEFLGTRFRRLPASLDVRRALVNLCKGAVTAQSVVESDSVFQQKNLSGESNAHAVAVESGLAQQRPLLICARRGEVTIVETQLEQFGNNDELFVADLRTYLDRAHALQRSIEDGMSVQDIEKLRRRMKIFNGGDSDEEEEDDTGDWCNKPGCTKKFHHTHVGIEGGNMVHAIDEQGLEALGR
jgi:hypothetical protein